MRKLLLSVGLFVWASNVIASDYVSQPSYAITESIEVKKVGVGQHNASMFSLMTGTVANQDHYIQIPNEIAKKVPRLNADADKKRFIFSDHTSCDLKILVDYMRIRHDIETWDKDKQTFNEANGISRNAFRAKQGMVDFVRKISVDGAQKEWLKTAVKFLYKEPHSIGLLDLPVTTLLQLDKSSDQRDTSKVSVVFNGNVFFQVPLEQAKSMWKDVVANSIVQYSQEMSEQAIIDVANNWALTHVDSGHTELGVWEALWEELPDERQRDLNKNHKGLVQQSNWSLKFPPTRYSHAKDELQAFWKNLKQLNGRGMFSIIKRNGTVLLGAAAILAAAVLMYKKLVK